MTTIDSSSVAESSMDNTSHDHLHLHTTNTVDNLQKTSTKHRRACGGDGFGDDGEALAGEGEREVWATFSKSFHQVQTVLDQNRVLIQQVNDNHQSKIPDNLTKNVALIREINGNISKVVSLYSDLSANFSNIVHRRRGANAKSDGNIDSNDKEEYMEA
ncbi:PREDICTED: protein EARLY FLOWERING 4-like [Nelumbo nucifera]|uniref:Protein EARLY FLOWERING 4-like n=2 Tax=Nelumbo nucifera TaxID=4432 RepID=A0A1U8Q770_NELNU|nr:PREDICTED: protein EARLY FLOWERING 4-like [Nelumbo nucifera]XP_019053925.1 PREDICTED: protein EARLY FLOWERING 4-like [Nelumbo nucifera]DAD28493.1 TPA_asm: hypothetical protein HUJ06_029961 [Nelumbo nucifera]